MKIVKCDVDTNYDINELQQTSCQKDLCIIQECFNSGERTFY